MKGNKSVAPNKQVRDMLAYAAMCTTAEIEAAERPVGDPTEISLLFAAKKIGISKTDALKKLPLVTEFNFDSKLKRMTTVHSTDGHYLICTKGAVEMLLEKCERIEKDGKPEKLSAADKKKIIEKMEQYAESSYRVIGVAHKIVELGSKEFDRQKIESGLTFLGMVAMYDAPRDEVYDAVKMCRKAGIDVKMLTGDYEKTAIAVAKEIGLLDENDRSAKRYAITSEQLDNMSDRELDKAVLDAKVFSRMTPEQKLRILRSLKRCKKVVAMTGDGVNDAPALKLADVGVAMGIMGTDVAKESGDIILLDDNFATIVEAIREGRTIFANIKKFIYSLLGHNLAEVIIVMVVATLAELALLSSTNLSFYEFIIPLLPLQLLWINLITDGLPAVALGFDPPAKDIMQRKTAKESILSKNVLAQLAILSVIIALPALIIFYYAPSLGFSVGLTRTIIFTYVVTVELVAVLSIRAKSFFLTQLFSNKFLIAMIGISLIAQLLALYTPLSTVLGTVPLTVENWYLVIGGIVFVLVAMELAKLILKEKIVLFSQ
jgi:Ca2+-transporting ATPase